MTTPFLTSARQPPPQASHRRANARALGRIGVNVAMDGGLAALALLLATWIGAPASLPVPGAASLAAGAAALLLAGLPFRLPQQYWRFTGMAELLAVAAASLAAATIFTLGLQLMRMPPANPAFPVVFGLCLLVLLGVPRMAYRLLHETRLPEAAPLAARSRPVLLVGAGDGADLFLRALAADPSPPWRAVGLLSLGQSQTGRRIQGCPILGHVGDAASVLAGLPREDGPPTIVVTDPAIPGEELAALALVARGAGARLASVPRPTDLQAAEV